MNKPLEIRKALDLTPTQAAEIFIGRGGKSGYNQWMKWENGDSSPGQAVEQYFNMILFLIMTKDLKTPGADQALDKFIAIALSDDE